MKNLQSAEKVYNAIVEYKQLHDGCAPGYRELVEATEITSTAHIKYLLERLQEEGRLRLGRGARSIELTRGKWVHV